MSSQFAKSTEMAAELTSRKSSAALREQIAKAKAAKRAAAAAAAVKTQPETNAEPVGGFKQVEQVQSYGFDSIHTGFSSDPFNQRRSENAKLKILQQRAEAARTSGRLNIAAMGLKKIPPQVMQMYDANTLGSYDGSWAESIDLTRLIAADNELEVIDDAIFPDADPNSFADDEDSAGNIFGGLDTLDLHGNLLISVPMGLRRLQLLTSLNLVGFITLD
jgi:hypothetical protein